MNHEDFEQSMSQFIQLLKKILTAHFSQGPNPLQEFMSPSKDQGVNLNLCFFTFLPMVPEELDEFEDLYERFLFEQEKKFNDFSNDLSAADLEFLRRHGIRF